MGHDPDNSNCRLVFGVVWFLLLNLNFGSIWSMVPSDISSVNLSCICEHVTLLLLLDRSALLLSSNNEVSFLAKQSFFISITSMCVQESRHRLGKGSTTQYCSPS